MDHLVNTTFQHILLRFLARRECLPWPVKLSPLVLLSIGLLRFPRIRVGDFGGQSSSPDPVQRNKVEMKFRNARNVHLTGHTGPM
ncbi:hypothetical protein Mp_3g00160 [Marchantia polymorpha subsp. ruderalis]|uniref:Uncharacterized protein n=2 Tax=Marchantia polymorpha TaxID=3197 RepID=A0AAF6AVT0_MARPO|nr:hypothetical protein MARPO_0284s0003 [Marchantia polymorpha]BBN03864.1 hypothetical protein Mp_3g00160 [Marchantia polymorpha subsp. ruderalis]|eukprot:PTQ26883.1 hypothetical protein MARPO_0284s0003 [Marchantia polymorpha]